MFASVGAAIAGWFLAQRAYKAADRDYKEPIREVSPRVYKTLFRKYYVDEFYDWFVTGRKKVGDVRLGLMGLGDALWKFDAGAIDGTVNGVGWTTRESGTLSSLWDKWIIDGLFVNGVAIVTRMASYPVRLVQWGLVQWYALTMVGGVLVLSSYYFVPEGTWQWARFHWFLSLVLVLLTVALAVFVGSSARRYFDARPVASKG
jgi:NADH-quinone oxidoreductase subunit L